MPKWPYILGTAAVAAVAVPLAFSQNVHTVPQQAEVAQTAPAPAQAAPQDRQAPLPSTDQQGASDLPDWFRPDQVPWSASGQDQNSAGQSGRRGASPLSAAQASALKAVYARASASAVRVNVGDSGIGSGFFLTGGGRVLTAAHVALGETGATLSVTTADGRTLPASLVGYDAIRDLAVLQVQGSNFPALTLAARTPAVGSGVVAIGNSRGSFDGGRAGAVTALGTSIDPTFPSDMVASSMPLAPGDSGGPVLNAQGQVVGVSTAISQRNGQFSSYFVPVTSSSAIVRDLMAGTKRGVPVLGISVADPQTAGLTVRGALVTAVAPKLGAAAAGLQAGVTSEYRDDSGQVTQNTQGGDLITAVDGRTVRAPDDLVGYLRTKQVGDTVTLRVVRSGQTRTVTVRLSARNA